MRNNSWMKAAGLFSGGKDSLYAMYLTEKQGVKVEHLICLIPSFSFPSPHAENIDALKILAESMKKSLTIVDLHKGEGEFVEALKRLEVNALVAGDVFVEQHVSNLEKICGKAGVDLLEPLFGRKTSDLFYEIFDSGFKALIIGVDVRYLGEEWLGFTLSTETANTFLSETKDVDPLGENGEYHTIVIECPLYPKPFKIKSSEKIIVKDRRYLILSIYQSCETFLKQSKSVDVSR
ncbi:diphthine--ammonia ligase [Candidatus Bathyarchaeota archaeon]|nr:diphthine--ammonia ligase [Candidatus Bathyarchaeota archaeon]